MIFTVIWQKSAENALAELWIQHPQERDAITKAANRIDTLLRTDPHLKGDPHFALTRSLLVAPLGVIFRVAEGDRLVKVLAVLYFPPYISNGFS
jgi:hypothetical protein